MKKVLFFSLSLCVSALNFCSSSPFTITNTKNNNVREVRDVELKLLWTWNQTPLTIQYSSLDRRTCLEQSVEAMLYCAFNGLHGRGLSKATSILVVIPRNSPDARVMTSAQTEFEGELVDDPDSGYFFSAKLNK